MSCIFKYDNKIFKSELALDEYLMQEERFKKLTGGKTDLVFSAKTPIQREISGVIFQANEIARGIKDENAPISFTSTDSGDLEENVEDGFIDNTSDKDSIGVSDFLHQFRKEGVIVTDSNDNTGRIFPVFNADAYWEKVFKQYREGNPPENQIEYVFGSADKVKPITDNNELLKIRQKFQGLHEDDKNDITGIWGQQKELGTLTHFIWSQYFIFKSKNENLNVNDARSLFVTNYNSGKYHSSINPRQWTKLQKFLKPAMEAASKTYDKIESKFGYGCTILSEMKLQSNILNPVDDKIQQLRGILDLVVITPKGDISILDFKCSTKDYKDYNPAKIRTYNYQLATYRRMLQQLGVGNQHEPTLYVVPIKYSNFKYNDLTHEGTIDGMTVEDNMLHELESSSVATGESMYGQIQTQLARCFIKKPIDPEKILTGMDGVNQFMYLIANNWTSKANADDEYITNYIKYKGGIVEDKSQHLFKFKTLSSKTGSEEFITASSKEEIHAMLKEELKKQREKLGENTKSLRSSIHTTRNDMYKDKENAKAYRYKNNNGMLHENGSILWTENMLQKYATPDWVTMYENQPKIQEVLDAAGIILFRNVYTNKIEIIKLSNSFDLGMPIHMGKNNRKNILGAFQPDVISKNMPKALSMDATEGNVELIQTMAVLNFALGNDFINSKNIVGNILVMNTYRQDGMSSSNARLLWNFNQLCKLSHTQNNFQVDDSKQGIKMASYLELVKDKLLEIERTDNHNKNIEDLRDKIISTCVNGFQAAYELGDRDTMLKELNNLKSSIEEVFHLENGKLSIEQSELDSPQYTLYAEIMEAMLELSNIDASQQINDHGKYIEGQLLNIIKGNGQGFNGSMLDNPGTLQSDTLNKLSELCTRAYQQTRDKVVNFNEDLREHVIKLRQSKGYSTAERYLIGNQATLYKNMFDEDQKAIGNLRFKNPWTDNSLLAGERDFLKYAIVSFVKNKIATAKTEEDVRQLVEGDELLLDCPLTKGSHGSKVASAGGLIKAFGFQFKLWDPRHILKRIKEEILNIYSDKDNNKIRNNSMWEMPNQFDKGEQDPQKRKNFISRMGGVNYFEQNLETLLLKHTTAYASKKNMDKVFPLIKALYVHLQFSGIIRNDKFTSDIEYLNQFIKNKIFNQPIDDTSKWGYLIFASQKLMAKMSKVALCFNPRQAYQFIDGIWKNISLVIRKPTGATSGDKEPFTKDNITKSYLWILKDLVNFSPRLSMGEAINMQYGINDMDMNDLAGKLKSDTTGIFNFWDIGFRFASRPDYYNRLTIFGAQMRADGCWEAHSMVNGKLVYDWTKDKRFDVYARGDKSNPKYNEQKALYYQVAQEFVQEGAINADGTEFVLNKNLDKPNPLPRAYTNKQSESLKALSDKIYGYYSHEKKSMIQAHSLGALFMQMNTFWSSKKNQWLAGEGYTQEGYYTQYEEETPNEDGTITKTKWYLAKDGNGFTPTKNKTNEDGSENIPYMIWKGRPAEGIIVTCARAGRIVFDQTFKKEGKGFSEARHLIKSELWNNTNPDLRRLYRANLGQLFFDLIAFLLFGCLVSSSLLGLVKDHIKETGNENFKDAALNNSMNLAANMFDSSTDDLNAIKSIFGRGVNWTPFSISTGKRLTTTFFNVVSGKVDAYDGFTRSFAATNAIQPMMDYVKLNTLGREIGDNGDDENS